MGRNIEDLTGKKFGHWTAIEKAENNKYNTVMWLCKCDCEKQTERAVRGTDLINGKSISCGCIRGKKFNDLTGQKFGNLIVIKRIENIGDKIQWLCICNCNRHNEVKVRASDLTLGKIRSCGCLRNTNRYEINDEYIIGITEDGDFQIDNEDYEKVSKYVWHKNTDGYFESTIYQNGIAKTLSMSRYIMNVNDDRIVDHENHDISNNRKYNLRVCNDAESTRNRGLFINNTSGKTGVVWHKKNRKWIVKITVNYKIIYLGSYKNKEDAIKARIEAEHKYFGDFRYKGGKDEISSK